MGKILFLDGFDHYDTAHFTSKWSTGVGIGPNPASGREGAGLDTTSYPAKGVKNLAASYNELIVGYAAYWYGLGQGVAAPSIGFASNGGDIVVGLGLDPAGAVRAYQETVLGDPKTSLGASASALVTAGAWYYFEYRFNLSAKTLVVHLNGVEVANLANVGYDPAITGVNQLIAQTGQINRNAWRIDDLYVLDPNDATGNAPNTFIGDMRVGYATVSAPGRLAQFAPTPSGNPNWQNVSENPPDDDATYDSSDTVGAVDSHKITAPIGTTNIIAVQIVALARKDSAGTRVVNVGLGNGVTEMYGPNHSLPDAYSYITEVLDTNPITGAKFQPADFATMELAMKVQA